MVVERIQLGGSVFCHVFAVQWSDTFLAVDKRSLLQSIQGFDSISYGKQDLQYPVYHEHFGQVEVGL